MTNGTKTASLRQIAPISAPSRDCSFKFCYVQGRVRPQRHSGRQPSPGPKGHLHPHHRDPGQRQELRPREGQKRERGGKRASTSASQEQVHSNKNQNKAGLLSLPGHHVQEAFELQGQAGGMQSGRSSRPRSLAGPSFSFAATSRALKGLDREGTKAANERQVL